LSSEGLNHLKIMASCPVYTAEEDFSHLGFANLSHSLENESGSRSYGLLKPSGLMTCLPMLALCHLGNMPSTDLITFIQHQPSERPMPPTRPGTDIWVILIFSGVFPMCSPDDPTKHQHGSRSPDYATQIPAVWRECLTMVIFWRAKHIIPAEPHGAARNSNQLLVFHMWEAQPGPNPFMRHFIVGLQSIESSRKLGSSDHF